MTYVRNPNTGRILPCCWSDCERHGHDEHKFVVPGEDHIPRHYIFCTEGHKNLYINSARNNGHLASGLKSRTTPGGLII